MDQGFPRLFVAGIFGLTGFMSVLGRIVFGFAADRIGRAPSRPDSPTPAPRSARSPCSRSRRWHHPASLYVVRAPLRRRLRRARAHHHRHGVGALPGRQFGRIYGALSLGNGIGGALGPWLGGAIYDVTGSYRDGVSPRLRLLRDGQTACFWLAARPPARSASP